MLRLCFATDSRDPSGMGAHMLCLAGEVGAEVTFAAHPGTALFATAQAKGYRVRALDDDADALARWFGQAGFDLVHVHAGIGWEGHGLARAARTAGVPVVRTEHLPFVITEDADRAAYAEGAASVDAVIAVSDAVARSYRDSGLVTAPITTIANGIAPNAAGSVARAERGRATRPLLLQVGRLAAQKNQALVIDAIARLRADGRDVDAMIVGEGPDHDALVARVRAAGLVDRVRLMGARRDVPALMGIADLLVHPSAFEGLPLVILEAMAAGLPIVATDTPGLNDAIGDDSAWIVPALDAEALAATIARALDDPGASAARAARASARQGEGFTAARMGAETRTLYDALLHADRPIRNRLRVGFIGAGGIAHRHLGVLRTMDDVTVVAVTDPDLTRAQEFAAQVGAEQFDDADALIASGRVDALFICVPPFAHGAAEEAAVAARLPFFVEKPVALDLDWAQGIAERVRDAGIVTAVGYHWRYLDTIDAVRHAMDGRRPRLVSGYWLDSTPPPHWWGQQAMSGGQMAEQATHLVDLARYLVGDVVSVYGQAEHTARLDWPHVDVATASTAALTFDNGAVGQVAATCLLRWNHRVGLHLFGDGFAIELTDHDVMIDVGHGRPVTGNGSDPVWRQDRAFVEAAMGRGDAIRCTYADALATARVVDAIGRSAATRSAVALAGDEA